MKYLLELSQELISLIIKHKWNEALVVVDKITKVLKTYTKAC